MSELSQFKAKIKMAENKIKNHMSRACTNALYVVMVERFGYSEKDFEGFFSPKVNLVACDSDGVIISVHKRWGDEYEDTYGTHQVSKEDLGSGDIFEKRYEELVEGFSYLAKLRELKDVYDCGDVLEVDYSEFDR